MRAVTDARRKNAKLHSHPNAPQNQKQQATSGNLLQPRTQRTPTKETQQEIDHLGSHEDLFAFEITDELRELASGFESLGGQIRNGFIPTSLIADLILQSDEPGAESPGE